VTAAADEGDTHPNRGSAAGTPLSFEVLVSGAGAGADPPALAPDTVTRCRTWFESHGATCHPVAGGLVCTMDRAVVRVLFGTDATPGRELPVPPELADAVEAITVPPKPTLFGPPGTNLSP
jgi:hypothetical protein